MQLTNVLNIHVIAVTITVSAHENYLLITTDNTVINTHIHTIIHYFTSKRTNNLAVSMQIQEYMKFI